MKIVSLFIRTLLGLSLILTLVHCSNTNAGEKKASSPEAVSSASPLEGTLENEVRVVKMVIGEKEITPRKFYVQAAEKVKIIITSTAGPQKIRFDRVNVNAEVKADTQTVVEFTTPEKPAKINYIVDKQTGQKERKGYLIAKGRS